MPLYDYQCSNCKKVTEVRHGFDDTYAEPCPACGGSLGRVFNPAPILFKGSGFYVTDSRKSSGESKSTESKSSESKSSGSESSGSKESAA